MEDARIRHLPIIDASGAFVGLLTHRDLLAASVSRLAEIDSETQEEIYSGIPVKEVMRTDVALASPDLPLRQAAEVLLTQKYGCLPVVESGKLVGILTASDFIRLSLELMGQFHTVHSAAQFRNGVNDATAQNKSLALQMALGRHAVAADKASGHNSAT